MADAPAPPYPPYPPFPPYPPYVIQTGCCCCGAAHGVAPSVGGVAQVPGVPTGTGAGGVAGGGAGAGGGRSGNPVDDFLRGVTAAPAAVIGALENLLDF